MGIIHEEVTAVSFTEEERAELQSILEQALSSIHQEKRRTEAPAYRQNLAHEEALIRQLVEKVR